MATAKTGTGTGTRSNASARSEIIRMLKDDHKRVKKSFREFGKLDPEADGERARQIIEQTCAELLLHATLEEEVFYPGAREGLEDASLIDEAEVEHMSAKQLIEQLQGMTPEDAKYAATFKVLGEYVQHHVQEEEQEMFPQLQRTKLDWADIADRMTSRREELESMLPEPIEAPAAKAPAAKKRAKPARRADEI